MDSLGGRAVKKMPEEAIKKYGIFKGKANNRSII